MAHHILCISWK